MTAPANDEGPTEAAVAPQRIKQDESPGCRGAQAVGQALRGVEGKRKANEFLTRLYAGQDDPAALALIVGMLYGAAQRGFCRAIVKALGVRHA
jgi:energy-converting hydrogenase Eha subunit B